MTTRTSALLALAIIAIAFTAGGCASESQYNEAITANRKAQENLASCRDRNRMLEQEKEALRSALEERDRELADRTAEIMALREANAELGGSLEDVQARAEKLRKDFEDLRNRPIRVLPVQVDAAIKKMAAQHPELIEYDEAYGMVKLKSDLTFASGSAQVSAEAATALKKLAGIVAGGEAGSYGIYVAGHTDDVPVSKPATRKKFQNNWGLASFRAISVIKTLADAGVAMERMAAIGFSEYHPVAPNKPGKKGNRQNRRVEIWIVPGRPFLSAAAGGAAPGK